MYSLIDSINVIISDNIQSVAYDYKVYIEFVSALNEALIA